MNVLGIEGTAHTIGVGIYNDEKDEILANVIEQYVGYEGILPREAADHHSLFFPITLKKALQNARLTMKDIDVIAVSQGPGIGAPLSFTVSVAKFLSSYYKKPIVAVNHPYAHIKIAEWESKIRNAIILYTSGGNTQILWQSKDGFYEILGETLDISVGNLFDTFARKANIRPANAVELLKYAEKGKFIELPYTVKGMNLQYGGLLTSALRALRNHPLEDVAYSLFETAFYMLAEVTERALHLKKAEGIILCGGVAQNKRLQEIMEIIAKENNVKFKPAKDEYNRDNGAMIAYAGYVIAKTWGFHDIKKVKPITNYRIDMMPVIIEDLTLKDQNKK